MDRRFDKRDQRTSDEYVPTQRGSLNDLSWYARNPNLLSAAAAFPYPYRPGMAINYLGAPSNTAHTHVPVYVPGTMVLDWIPSFGRSTYSDDPASVAGKEFYGKVRAAYSGALDADAPDYITYIGALDSVFTYIGWLKRVYRTLSTYTIENVSLAESLMVAYGFTPTQLEDLRVNKVRFWQNINELILKSRKFRCPAVMDLFNRHYWMSDNVYADAPTPRAQLYVFNVRGVFKIGSVREASAGETITGLVMTPISVDKAGNTNVDQYLINFGKSLITALDAWDDCYTISGYLQRAFDAPDFTIAELLADELITAQYVPEVLSQIENSRPIARFTEDRNLFDSYMSQITVSQNVLTNAVVTNVDFKNVKNVATDQTYNTAAFQFFSGYPAGVQPVLNIRSDNPMMADTVIASRLHAYSEVKLSAATAGVNDYTVYAGSEVPLSWSLVTKTGGSSFTSFVVPSVILALYSESTSGTPVTISSINDVLSIDQFDWHPFLFALSGNATSMKIGVQGDMYNPSLPSPDDLENLHKICLYSELNSFSI